PDRHIEIRGVVRLDTVAKPDDALADDAALVVEILDEELHTDGRRAVLVVDGAAEDGPPALLPRLPGQGEESIPSWCARTELMDGRRRRHRLHRGTAGDPTADQDRSSQRVYGFHVYRPPRLRCGFLPKRSSPATRTGDGLFREMTGTSGSDR